MKTSLQNSDEVVVTCGKHNPETFTWLAVSVMFIDIPRLEKRLLAGELVTIKYHVVKYSFLGVNIGSVMKVITLQLFMFQ